MKNVFLVALSMICFTIALEGAAKHPRNASRLPQNEQKFSDLLSIHKRRIFCGQFNHKQREIAMKYARGRGQDACYTPDEAVIKVMEETGMSLAIKGRPQIQKK